MFEMKLLFRILYDVYDYTCGIFIASILARLFSNVHKSTVILVLLLNPSLLISIILDNVLFIKKQPIKLIVIGPLYLIYIRESIGSSS